MAVRLRPLPQSLDPLEDESIHGYLLRLAHRFGTAPLEIAVRTGLVVQGRGRNGIPVRLLHDLDEQRLDAFARATRLTPDEVRGLLTAPLGERYGPLNARLLAEFRTPTSMVHNNRWILTRATRYCPRCLSGDGTEIEERHGGCWRRSWRLPPVFACLRHQRTLLYGCPRCGQDINAARASSLIARASEADLHPAQCRAAIAGTRAICGAEPGRRRGGPTLPRSLHSRCVTEASAPLRQTLGPRRAEVGGQLRMAGSCGPALRRSPRPERVDLHGLALWRGTRRDGGSGHAGRPGGREAATLSSPSPGPRPRPDGGANHHTATATRRRIPPSRARCWAVPHSCCRPLTRTRPTR